MAGDRKSLGARACRIGRGCGRAPRCSCTATTRDSDAVLVTSDHGQVHLEAESWLNGSGWSAFQYPDRRITGPDASATSCSTTRAPVAFVGPALPKERTLRSGHGSLTPDGMYVSLLAERKELNAQVVSRQTHSTYKV